MSKGGYERHTTCKFIFAAYEFLLDLWPKNQKPKKHNFSQRATSGIWCDTGLERGESQDSNKLCHVSGSFFLGKMTY
jgi:hypothetical protein